MSGLFSKPSLATQEPALGALKVQTSAYGLTIPVIYGRTQVAGNLLDYTDFKSVPVEERSEAGKGGGSQVTRTSYTYKATVLMALGEGLVGSVRRIWVGKELYAGEPASSREVQTSEEFTIGSDRTVTVSHASVYATPGEVSLLQAPQPVGEGVGVPSYWDAVPPSVAEGRDFTRSGGTYTFLADYIGYKVRIAYSYTISSDAASALGQIGMALKTGQIGQAAWSYMASAHPSDALGYSGIAYVYAQDYAVDNSAQVPNHRFEVDGQLQFSGTIPDANPADVMADILRNDRYGVQGFQPAHLAPLTEFRDYCTAAGLFISPAYAEQRAARDVLGELLDACNADACWLGDQLKIVPRGDQALTGNGVTFTPNMTPVFDLGVDDILGEPTVERIDEADIHNRISIQCLNGDRELPAGAKPVGNYMPTIVEAVDEASIAMTGERAEPTQSWHMFADTKAARAAAWIRLQRKQAVRARYKFKLPWRYMQLQLGDLVNLTDSRIVDGPTIAKITAKEEGAKDAYSFTAELFPIGHANAALIAPQLGSGFQPQHNADPGPIVWPAFVEPPGGWTGNGLEVWVAASGASPDWGGCEVYCSFDDGTSYKNIGRIDTPARYGTVVNPIGMGSAEMLVVQLAGRGGKLQPQSAEGLDAAATLCFVGDTATGEWLSYSSSGLNAPNRYVLSSLSRGRYGSSDKPHATGETFVLCDTAVAESGPLPQAMIGKTLKFKFCSFNIFGAGLQSLADVPEYTYKLTGRFMKEGSLPIGNHATAASFPFGPHGWRSWVSLSGGAWTPASPADIFNVSSVPYSAGLPAPCQVASPSIGTRVLAVDGIGMAVRPGQRVQAFASILPRNVRVRVGVEFRAPDGSILDTKYSDSLSPIYPWNAAFWSGNPERQQSNYTAIGGFWVAPINAATANLVIAQDSFVVTGQAGSHWMLAPYIGLADYEQRAFSDWTPSAVAPAFAFFESIASTGLSNACTVVAAVDGVAELVLTGTVSMNSGTYVQVGFEESSRVPSPTLPNLQADSQRKVLTRSTGTVTEKFEVRYSVRLAAGNRYRFTPTSLTDASFALPPSFTNTRLTVAVQTGN